MSLFKRHLPALAVLAALNAFICAHLFTAEYLNQFSSIDGAFISLAHYLSRHWGNHSWWPIWHCGMPFEDTYVPLLHLTVAALATLSRISAAHAYHIVVATAYTFGPVTLYLMVVYLGADRGSAFAAAAIYSLFSPAALLMPAVAQDLGGIWFGRRLQILTVYGEGPHIAALTLLPLAIVALGYALRQRTGRALAYAAAALALIFLINVPGSMATGLAVFCWIVVQPAGKRRAAWMVAACAAVFAYALACYGIPPSSEVTVLENIGRMHQGFSAAAKIAPFVLVALLAAIAGAGWWLARTRVPLAIRFATVFLALTAALVLSDRPKSFELLPQAGRLQLEMEMAFCILAGSALWYLYRVSPWRLRIVLATIFAIGAGYQIDNYHQGASKNLKSADLQTRSEYTSAMWAASHLAGQRVYVTGSDSFWWNAFTDVPQVIGCCDQGESLAVLANVPYLIDPATGPYHEVLTKAYLQVLGAQAIVVSGPKSTDEYKDIQGPDRFDAMFPVLYREHGDTIYAVPQRSSSLAHVVQAADIVPASPTVYQVYAYAQKIADPAHGDASFEWLADGVARVRATLKRDDLVAVEVPWFAGWKAWVGGRRISVSADGLGFQILHPGCEGVCEIALRWTGRPDRIPSAIVTLLALGFLAILVSGKQPWRQPKRV